MLKQWGIVCRLAGVHGALPQSFSSALPPAAWASGRALVLPRVPDRLRALLCVRWFQHGHGRPTRQEVLPGRLWPFLPHEVCSVILPAFLPLQSC